MMSVTVASVVCDRPVTMDNVECCVVSFPEFLEVIEGSA